MNSLGIGYNGDYGLLGEPEQDVLDRTDYTILNGVRYVRAEPERGRGSCHGCAFHGQKLYGGRNVPPCVFPKNHPYAGQLRCYTDWPGNTGSFIWKREEK